MEKLNLFYPQWQGSGPDLSPFNGAIELKKYLAGQAGWEEVRVSTCLVTDKKNDIFGYDDILLQMKEAARLIDFHRPQKIFTLGGGCDAGLLPIAYLNALYSAGLTVLWFDAHGDLNTPRSSPSGYFYGMPARTLLGEGDPIFLNLLPSILRPEQVIMAGLRDLDPAEAAFIEQSGLKLLSVKELEAGSESIIAAVESSLQSKPGAGMNGNIYIHLDLDVLDPEAFPHVPVPAPGGLKPQTLLSLINVLNTNFNLVGLGIYEYSASGKQPDTFLKEIFRIGIDF